MEDHAAVISPASIALVLGVFVGLTFGNPFAKQTKKLTTTLLQLAIVGLGASMNLNVIGRVGLDGVAYTVVGISCTLFLGYVLGRIFKIQNETSVLVSVGTAICGGSAIAAVAPAIDARDESISVSLATVFLLNAVALLIFPAIGHLFNMSEIQFGLFSALAVHDTSSVVGTSMQYGAEALVVATTVKLTRALWIIPVTLLIGYFWSRSQKSKPKFPFFILGFLATAALVTYFPQLRPFGETIAVFAKWLMVITLFLIGTGLSRKTLQSVGIKPFLQGTVLWIIVSSLTLAAILSGLIK